MIILLNLPPLPNGFLPGDILRLKNRLHPEKRRELNFVFARSLPIENIRFLGAKFYAGFRYGFFEQVMESDLSVQFYLDKFDEFRQHFIGREGCGFTRFIKRFSLPDVAGNEAEILRLIRQHTDTLNYYLRLNEFFPDRIYDFWSCYFLSRVVFFCVQQKLTKTESTIYRGMRLEPNTLKDILSYGISDPGIPSWTHSSEVGIRFSCGFNINDTILESPENVLLKIPRYVFYCYQERLKKIQSEGLIAPLSRFRVTAFERDGNLNIVTLEQVARVVFEV